MTTHTLGFVRFTVTLQAQRSVAWPHFAGSALRGAFGHALRRAACMTGQTDCGGCALRAQCAYATVFEPPPPSNPLHPSFRNGIPRYVVHPPSLGAAHLERGHTIEWGLLLLPGAQPHRPLIEHSLRQGLGQHLLQAGDFETSRLEATEQPWPTKNTPSASDSPAHWRLKLITPLRLQKNGQPLRQGADITPEVLVRAALRRQLQACQLANLPAQDPAAALMAAAQCSADTRLLRWHDMRRHSTRQERHVPLGGLVGTMQLHGPPKALSALQPVMALAQQMNLGKETIVGLGQFTGIPAL